MNEQQNIVSPIEARDRARAQCRSIWRLFHHSDHVEAIWPRLLEAHQTLHAAERAHEAHERSWRGEQS